MSTSIELFMLNEHILFISAGAHIDETYSITVQNLNPTHVFVLAETKIFEPDASTDTPFFKEEKPKIREAIINLENKVKTEDLRQYRLIKLPELDQDVIRDEIIKIRNTYKDADYSFNITAGTALFSTSLFLMAIWLGGRACITRSKFDFLDLKIPKMSVKELESYPALMRIVLALGRKINNKNMGSDDGWMRNKELLVQLGVIAVERERVKNTDKVNQTRDMEKLKVWEFVEERKTGREIEYRLTADGIFAYNIFREQ